MKIVPFFLVRKGKMKKWDCLKCKLAMIYVFHVKFPGWAYFFPETISPWKKRAYIFAQFFAPRLHLIMKITRARRCQVNWIFKLCIKKMKPIFIKIPLLFLTASLKRRLFLCQTFFCLKDSVTNSDYLIIKSEMFSQLKYLFKIWPVNNWSN